MSSHIIDVPYAWEGREPRCMISSLLMLLRYFGVECSRTFIANVSGEAYGFVFFPEMKVAYASFNPSRNLAYCSSVLGFQTDIVCNKPWHITWDILKKNIDNDTPIIAGPVRAEYLWKTSVAAGTYVLIVGYNEASKKVYVHDTFIGENGEGVQYTLLPINLPKDASGKFMAHGISDFQNAMEGSKTLPFGCENPMIIIKPSHENYSEKLRKLQWDEILERNAELIEGSDKDLSGIYGIKELSSFIAEDLKKSSEEEILSFLRRIRGTAFVSGAGTRKEASSFLAGVTYASKESGNLLKASMYLSEASILYDNMIVLLDYAIIRILSHKDYTENLRKISSLLRRAAEKEQVASNCI